MMPAVNGFIKFPLEVFLIACCSEPTNGDPFNFLLNEEFPFIEKLFGFVTFIHSLFKGTETKREINLS